MTTATAIAHPNIALVKYWGKRDVGLNLPAVSSLSLTLSGFTTKTQVRWGASEDSFHLNGVEGDRGPTARVMSFLDHLDSARPPCAVDSENDFPSSAGLASSSSAFAALAVAAAAASGRVMDRPQLSRLARRGSGSACRSLWGGFVEWQRGQASDGTDSHGVPLGGSKDWDVVMVVAVVDRRPKPVGSTAGMERTRANSPLYRAWIDQAEADVEEARRAVQSRDLQRLGEVMEASTFKMHGTMMTASPPLLYWQPNTVACLHAVFKLRAQGVGAWATMDAGPQVKVLCAAADAERVALALRSLVQRVHVLTPGRGAQLLES